MTAPGSRMVLLVDDAEDVHFLVRALLRRANLPQVTLHSAFDGREGLERLRAQRYDLMLTDINMPLINGPDLVERMRAEGFMVPTVLMGGMPNQPPVEGTLAVIDKVDLFDHLGEHLRAWLGL